MSLVTFFGILGISVAVFALSSRVANDQERQLLTERTDEVEALLVNSFASIDSSLRIVGPVGASADASASALFAQAAGSLVSEGTSTIGVATARDGDFEVVAAVGGGAAVGDQLSGARAALAARALALDDPQMVTDLITEDGQTTLVLARATGSQSVAYQESVLNPREPIQSPPDSPFSYLRLALYAAPDVDVDRVVLTTESTLPISLLGDVVRIPLPVGADQWMLAVGARDALGGSLARIVPWLLLAGGIVTALLATAMVATLLRRRAYAMNLVAERTQELQEALSQLGSVRTFLDRLLTAGPVLVTRIVVSNHQLSYVSPNVERILGVAEEQALSSDFLNTWVHPDDRAGFDAALDRVSPGASVREVVEHRIHRGDASYRWVSTTLVPDDAAGPDERAAVLAYVIDVDDRHRAEDARREAQEAAEDANRSKSQFLSRMSHELRTPLNSVLGFGQLLALEDLSDAQRDSVDHILKGGRHLLNLINEVLDISRIEAGELALSPEAVLAADVVKDAVDLMRPLAGQRGITLSVDGSGACDCHVFADRQRVHQVLLNLLSNAAKYNRIQGTVVVSCKQDDPDWLSISVTDTGMGIPAERLGMLFTAFERLGAEHGSEEGTGIGLALSKRLTEAMGGTLEAVSALGQGSTFTLRLPRVEGPVDRYERLNGRASAPERTEAPRRVVLHIEDNLANLTLVERILEQRPGLEVVAAMYGRLGLELANDHRPDIVLLDLHLPDMSGDQVLQRLRDNPATATIPVVIVSADATPGQVQRLLSAGAAAYLTKPIDVRELLRLIDDAVEQP